MDCGRDDDFLELLHRYYGRVIRALAYAATTAGLIAVSPVDVSWGLVPVFAVFAMTSESARIAQLGMLLLTVCAIITPGSVSTYLGAG